MTATTTNPMCETITVSGKTLGEIYSKLRKMLSVSGPRTIAVTTDTGAEIRCSLYEGQSYIRSSNGRTIRSS